MKDIIDTYKRVLKSAIILIICSLILVVSIPFMWSRRYRNVVAFLSDKYFWWEV